MSHEHRELGLFEMSDPPGLAIPRAYVDALQLWHVAQS